jgi:hypothetical protein
MSARIRGLTPQIPTDNTSPVSTISQTTCNGLPPKKNGKFNTFRCAVTWDEGRGTVWARALPGGKWCASSTGLLSCPPTPPSADDPRVCATGAPGPTTADPNRCALAATEYAILRAMPVNFSDPGWTMRNLACKGSNVTRTCTFSSRSAYGVYYTSTIGFVQDESTKAWIATIVTKQGAGTTTCTVQAGSWNGRSRWQSGTAPTCSAES